MNKLLNTIRTIARKSANNNLLLLLSFITIIHVIILAIYFQQSKNTPYANDKHHVTRSLLTFTIHASQTMPLAEVTQLISHLTSHPLKINNYDVYISTSSKPKWPLQFNKDTSLKIILSALPKNKLPARLSYQLSNKLWLNYSEVNATSSYSIAVLLIFIEMFLIGLVLFYNFSLQRFSIPLQNFKDSAERLGIDVNATPIRVYGTKLVRETANAMNKMQARLQDLINRRTKMLAAISHDLRTPITRLKLRACFLEGQEQASKIIADLDEMETMINGILLFAREDYTSNKKIIFDLNSLLASICDDYADLNRPIHAELLGQRLPFLGSPLALKRVFNNLIQNAFKYSSEVWVRLSCVDKRITIMIEDNGPGIPNDELAKVFQPYYRAKNVVSQSSAGAGLGLTIANEIIHAHNGKIQLRNRTDQNGLQVIVTLPTHSCAASVTQ